MRVFPEGKPSDAGTAGYFMEILIASTALLALVGAGLIAARGAVLFTSPLWLDEHHTLLLSTHGSWSGIFSSLARGADFNPPTLFLLERIFGSLMGGADALSLRILAVVSVWLTLVVVYAILRRDFGRPAAFAGALALWAHPFVVYHAFEARFYGPLLLFSALFILTLAASTDDDRSLPMRIGAGVSAVLLCTVHDFGLFVWAIVVVTVVFRSWPLQRARLSRALPALAGPVALLACAPLYLGQRASVTVSTWVPKLSAGQVKNMLDTFFVTRTPVLAVLVAIGVSLLYKPISRMSSRNSDGSSSGTASLVALAAMPLIIMVFSIVVQPAMIARYAIPAVLIWGPVVAWSVDRIPRVAQGGVIFLLAAGSAATLRGTAATSRGFVAALSADSAVVAPLLKEGKLVLVPSRHVLYKLATRFPPETRLAFFDFDNTQAKRLFGVNVFHWETNESVLERDVGRIHHAIYGFPQLVGTSALDSVPEFYLYLPENAPTSLVTRLMPDRKTTTLTP